MTYEEKIGEITACKYLLQDTDYQIIKNLESLFSCESTIELLQKLKETASLLKETIQNRENWRKTINDLEVEIKTEEPSQME